MPLTVVQTLTEAQIEQLWALYQHEWWSKGRGLEDVCMVIRHSNLVIGLVDRAAFLVAFARVWTDQRYRALLLDVIVADSLRRRGVGTQLMQAVLTHPLLARVESIVLFCRPELVAFYRRYGFAASDSGIIAMRKRQMPMQAPS